MEATQTTIGNEQNVEQIAAAPVAAPESVMSLLATPMTKIEDREPRADDKLQRCGNIFRSKFNDQDKALVAKVDGLPTIFVTQKGIVWTEVLSMKKDDEGHLVAGKYDKHTIALDTLHPSASGQSYIFRGFGQTHTMSKAYFEDMMSGKERNCMIKRSPIESGM